MGDQDKKFTCPVEGCGKRFFYNRDVYRHARLKHGAPKKRPGRPPKYGNTVEPSVYPEEFYNFEGQIQIDWSAQSVEDNLDTWYSLEQKYVGC